jgi:hypothetical protein
MKTLSKEAALNKLSQHFDPIDYAYKNALSGDKTSRGLNVTIEVDELLLEFTADCEYNPKEPFLEFLNAKDSVLWLDDDTMVIVLGSEIEKMFSTV